MTLFFVLSCSISLNFFGGTAFFFFFPFQCFYVYFVIPPVRPDPKKTLSMASPCGSTRMVEKGIRHSANFEFLFQTNRDVHVIGIRSKTKLSAKVLHEAKNLLVIGCFCIGTNQVDLEYAAKHGISVFNSPFSNSRSVAELVISEIITLARQLGDRSMEMHNGTWNKVSVKCWEIRGKTLGKFHSENSLLGAGANGNFRNRWIWPYWVTTIGFERGHGNESYLLRCRSFDGSWYR